MQILAKKKIHRLTNSTRMSTQRFAISAILFAISWICASQMPIAATPRQQLIAMDLRANRGAAAAHCESQNQTNLNCSVAEDDTKEFASGNTFVRVISDVAGANIQLLIDKKDNGALTANDLMEALIKTYTAKQLGARRVEIVTSQNLNQLNIEGLGAIDVEALFAEAGAAKVKNDRLRSLTRPRVMGYVAGEDQHSSMVNDLSEMLAMPIVNLNSALPHDLNKSEVFYIVSSAAPSNLNLLKALRDVRQLRTQGARVHLISPYLLYARSEKPEAGVVAITKLIANLFEAAGISSVTMVRPHAIASVNAYNVPSIVVSGRETLTPYARALNAQIVVAPDAGAQKDDTLYADDLKIGISVINKQRDPITSKSKIIDMSGPTVEGKTVVIIDDETASGSTLCESAAFLKLTAGASRVLAMVTHLAGSARAALTCEHIDEVIVTDTIQISPELLERARNDLATDGKSATDGKPKFTVLNMSTEIGRSIVGRHLAARGADLRATDPQFVTVLPPEQVSCQDLSTGRN